MKIYLNKLVILGFLKNYFLYFFSIKNRRFVLFLEW